jgi:hypothetical protein
LVLQIRNQVSWRFDSTITMFSPSSYIIADGTVTLTSLTFASEPRVSADCTLSLRHGPAEHDVQGQLELQRCAAAAFYSPRPRPLAELVFCVSAVAGGGFDIVKANDQAKIYFYQTAGQLRWTFAAGGASEWQLSGGEFRGNPAVDLDAVCPCTSRVPKPVTSVLTSFPVLLAERELHAGARRHPRHQHPLRPGQQRSQRGGSTHTSA